MKRGVSIGEEPRIAVMYLDAAGLPRAYAVGPVSQKADIQERARGHLERWCARMGHEPGDFSMVIEPFVAAPKPAEMP